MNPTNYANLLGLVTGVIMENREDSGRERSSGSLELLRIALSLRKDILRRSTGAYYQEASRRSKESAAELGVNLFLSQSFNPDTRSSIRKAVNEEAIRLGMALSVGDERPFDSGKDAKIGPSDQYFVSTIKRRIRDCDVFLCIVTRRPDEDVRLRGFLGSWFSFETGIAYAYGKPLLLMCEDVVAEEAKKVFGWTELQIFRVTKAADFDAPEFRGILRSALRTLDSRLFEAIESELMM